MKSLLVRLTHDQLIEEGFAKIAMRSVCVVRAATQNQRRISLIQSGARLPGRRRSKETAKNAFCVGVN